ncbi:TonB-dependent receptor [Pseudoflavitalea sp. X16]|uniref:SusC/RagA family TonB-linked outer membrane protein n=1 Tax=Paraflavitalea devenefica TaxID=2716334 RepID=UPI0014221FEB|nr:TonB-dependent receptor [Paraflavitalea devenefica]NII28832.1 TonB-dependent receptor [Paraflavitalea devenefica]
MQKKIATVIPLPKGRGVLPKLLFLLVTVLVICSNPLRAQTGTVSGTVTTENNEPLSGASVLARQSGKAVMTDAKGQFTVAITANDVLVITYAGYAAQEILVGEKTVVNVRLKEDAKMLEEVSIGYQRLRKSDLTGAVSSVKAKELTLTSPTLSQALVGKVAGVQVAQVSGAPYAGTKIRVRGIGSVNASSEPLYVVDGYPVGGNVSQGPGNGTNATTGYNPGTSGNDIFINPDDIESIEILKDAASAAIYGSRAAAGVVLITTKRGKQGKGKLNYDYMAGINQLAKKVDMLDSYEFARLFVDGRNGAYKDQVIAKGITWNDAYYSDDNAARIARLGSNPGNVTIIKALYDFPTQTVLKPQYNTDWQDELYRNALMQRHNVSFSGGNNNTRYLISGGYQDQDGILKFTYQKRINLRANIDADITPRLKVSSSMFVTDINNREVQEGRFHQGPILGALVYMPIFPVYNANGSYALGNAAIPIDGYNYAFQGIENPVALADRVKITRKGTRGTYNASASYEFFPGLSGKVNIGAQTYNEKYEYYYPTNLSSGANPPGSPAAIRAANTSAQTINMLDKLAEFTLNYKKAIGKGNLNVLAGYSAQETTNDMVSVGANGLSSDYVQEITARGADAANFYINGGTGKSVTTLVSYLARAIYTYDNKYFVTGSFRTDASSRFGPENRWGYFPSVSAGWNLSNEKFYGDWLGAGSTIKLRASWGLTGNNNIGNYNYQQPIQPMGGAVFGNTVNTAFSPGNLADPKLGWESTSQFNFGADLGLLNNRVNLMVNYYISKSYDLLFNQNVTAGSGSTKVLTNLSDADIRNRGIDAQVDVKVINTKDFSLNLSGNITHNKNEVVSLGGASTIFTAGAERSYITHATMEGQPVGMFYGLRVAGMVRQSDMANIAADNAALLPNNTFPTGYKLKGPPRSVYSSTPLNPGDLYFVDVNGDGIVNEADKQVIGSPYPDFTYGFGLSASYKQFDFMASFNGSQGNDVIDGQDYYINNMEGSGNNYAIVKNRYRSEAQPGDGKIYRASRGGTQSNSTRLSDYYLQDGSFFRCTNITLGYSLGNLAVVKKLGLSSLRVYGSVDNAFTITNYLGYNPEVDYNNGTNLAPGVDYGKYPLMRAFNLGVKMQF